MYEKKKMLYNCTERVLYYSRQTHGWIIVETKFMDRVG